MQLGLVLCFYFLIQENVESARILGFFMIPSISHQFVFQPIWKELSLRGHEVTVVSPNILNDTSLKNCTEIDVSFSYEVFKRHDIINRLLSDMSSFKKRLFMFNVFEELIVGQLEYEPVKRIIEDHDRMFDVILLEGLHPLPLGFGHRFKAPVILINSFEQFVEVHEALGNPSHPLLNPDIFVQLDEDPTFFQRLSSFIYHLQLRLYYRWIYLRKLDGVAKKYFGNDLPHLGDLQKNVSLTISNKNPFTFNVRANLPTFIEVSHIHLKKKKNPLPTDIQEFLDSAPGGVIYFSLGTNVKSSELSPEIRNTILDTLRELPYKVIWKWEQDHLPNQPKNVFIKKWLPQQDILGHPNIKAFITQGGLQSIEEAVFNEVPMVILPVLLDQHFNARKMTELGIAVTLDYNRMSKSELSNAIMEVIKNRRYKANMKRTHEWLLDQPVDGLDKAIWWIEYVIRNGGTPQFRNPALKLPFYKYHMLDVIGFLIAVNIIIILSFVKFLQLVGRKQQKAQKIKRC